MSSPINSRTNAQPLSLDLLKIHVPIVREGQEAIKLLADGTERTRIEANTLLKQKQKGSRAQEVLILSALPLIKNISSKEFQRRRAWSSRVSYDDVLQEAIAGFIRGLLSYDETANHSSPTNYLGQWITTSIRRKVEALEHDFAIPYEVVERARRIRAVKSRLSNELSRTPTDEELLDGLNEVGTYPRGSYKWGKNANPLAPVSPVEEITLPEVAPKATVKKFTQAHLVEARDLAARSYSLQSYDTPTMDSEESYEKASTPITIEEKDANTNFEDKDLASSRNGFFNSAFLAMKIGSRQKDIILRYFGMEPYDEPQTQKEIITNTALPPRFVKAVIATFSIYMPLKGGVFHQLIIITEPDIIESLELTWLLPLLGEWPKGQKHPEAPPLVLTQSGTKATQKKN
jgi:DNA-directed RNA polymerase sigma subunit (sigma70/sigma32)